MARLWWFDGEAFKRDRNQEPDLPPEAVLSWHQLDRCKVVRRLALSSGQHAQRTGRHPVRWACWPNGRYRLTLWTHQELVEADQEGAL